MHGARATASGGSLSFWAWDDVRGLAPVVHIVLDRVPVGDERVHAGLVAHRALDREFGRLVIRAVHVLFVEVRIRCAARIDPHQADDAQLVRLVFRQDAFDQAIDDRIGRGRLHDPAEQLDRSHVPERHLGHDYRGGPNHLIAGADGEHGRVSFALRHHVRECMTDGTIDAADQDFWHGVGRLARRGEYGGFAGAERQIDTHWGSPLIECDTEGSKDARAVPFRGGRG